MKNFLRRRLLVKRNQKIWLAVGLLHLGFVTAGAFQADLRMAAIEWMADQYGKYSGSKSGYGFFAPGVDTVLRATFRVFDAGGKVIAVVPLEQGKNREADLRVGNIIGWFWRDNPQRKQQRAMTASWAGKIFARYPKATAVEVVLEQYDLPSMAEFRAGERPKWTQYYTAKFMKRAET